MNDFNKIHAIYHSDIAKRALEDQKRNLEVINTDFLIDLPDPIRNAVDNFRWRYSNRKWFPEAWEEYRKHVLEAGLGGKIKMPGSVFNKYLDKYELKELEKLYATGPEAVHSEELYEDYLAHHGVKGQRWGVRRFQDENGELTAEGKERYGVDENGKMSKEGKKQYAQDKKDQKTLNRSNFANAAIAGTKTAAKYSLAELAVIGAGHVAMAVAKKKGVNDLATAAVVADGVAATNKILYAVGTVHSVVSASRAATEKERIYKSHYNAEKSNKK